MTRWKLEWLRLFRTKRWIAILGIFVLIGVLAPVTTYYLSRLIPPTTGSIRIQVLPPHPYDSIAYYVENALALGVFVSVIAAVSPFTVDAHRGLSLFYRSRVPNAGRLIIPKYLVILAATLVSFLVGLLLCWGETSLLLGHISLGRIMVGSFLACIYIAFALALCLALSTLLRAVLPALGFTVAFLLVIPFLGASSLAARWIPSSLIGSVGSIAEGSGFSSYGPAAGMTVCATVILVFFSIFLVERSRDSL